MRTRRIHVVAGCAAIALLAAIPLAAGAIGLLPLTDEERHDHRAHVHKDTARDSHEAVAARAAVPEGRLSNVPCQNGMAGPFSCDGVDLLSFVPSSEFAGLETDPLADDFGEDGAAGLSDLWGWTDSEAGDDGILDEYVIVGKTNGVGFFRVTDPMNPEYLGELPNTAPVQLVWHDVKVYKDHAFIVSESAAHGMQVFDLTQLRDATGDDPQVFPPTSHYPLNFSAHNIAIDEKAGFAYLLGSNVGIVGQDPCSLHIVNISTPALPTPAGCWSGDRVDPGGLRLAEYVHDAQCTIYEGPDADHQGKEICFLADEINVSIVDVTDKTAPVLLSQVSYPDVAYAHQGWLTEDHEFFLLGDELDEEEFGLPTRTMVFDVRDLDENKLHFEHLHDTVAIDHNMYTKGQVLYQSNYTAGLRVLDTTGVESAKVLNEIGFFDTFPGDDEEPTVGFFGTWSNYPYFESGTVAVSGMDEGLFLLRVQDKTFNKVGKLGGAGKKPTDPGNQPVGDPTVQDMFYAISCVRADESNPACDETTYRLSAQPGDSSVGSTFEFTPLNEAFFVLDGSEPTQQYSTDDTLPDQFRLRGGEPITGQITLQSFGDAGAGLTTVYVEVTGKDANGSRVTVGNATVTQPMLPGGPTVFEFSIDIPPELDGVVVGDLTSGVAVRGANLLAGFTDGEGGSFLTLPSYTR